MRPPRRYSMRRPPQSLHTASWTRSTPTPHPRSSSISSSSALATPHRGAGGTAPPDAAAAPGTSIFAVAVSVVRCRPLGYRPATSPIWRLERRPPDKAERRSSLRPASPLGDRHTSSIRTATTAHVNVTSCAALTENDDAEGDADEDDELFEHQRRQSSREGTSRPMSERPAAKAVGGRVEDSGGRSLATAQSTLTTSDRASPSSDHCCCCCYYYYYCQCPR